MIERFDIAGYCRISVDEELDRDNTSIENQKAIISYREFACVKALLESRSTDHYRGQKKYDNVYSGYLKCGDCGSHYPRLDVIKGRSDDMFKVHGVNMFPSQVEELLGGIDGVSSEYKIDIAHDDEKNRDIILLTVEAEGRVNFDKTGESIRNAFKSRMSVTPKVVVVSVGTLPRSEKKTKRVFDHREE